MEILRLAPVLRDRPWGGTRLGNEYGIGQAGKRIAEAWMLSCHPEGRVRVIGGEYDGRSLPEVLTKHPEYMGVHAKKFGRFPLMIKLIDAQDDLSITVHPDDEYAADTDDAQGKTELWYIIDALPDAEIIYGFNKELTQEQFRQAIADGSIVDAVEHFKARAGDVYFIEAGTVHAAGKGVVFADIMQNSASSYTVYDYDRVDEDGNKLPLNIDKAIDVAITVPPTFPPGPLGSPANVYNRSEMLLGECDYFRSVIMDTRKTTHFDVDGDSFASVIMIEGEAKFHTDDSTIALRKGESAFIPAAAGRITVTGRSIFIVTTI